MENVKIDENCLVPDIRPENIETITETYAPSGGGEQTATYKILNVHPIINGILDKLAFFRTHAAAVWYNKLAGRTVEDEIEDLNTRKVIAQDDLLTFHDDIEVKQFSAYKVGHSISFYTYLKAVRDFSDNSIICSFNPNYRPMNGFITVPARASGTPYKEIATIWIGADGRALMYGAIVTGQLFYMQGAFVC